jgi:hypothetical protein
MKIVTQFGFKIITIVTLLMFLQACSAFRTCGTILENSEYQESQNFKAIAMYFDRETQKPPPSVKNIANECWFDYEAMSQEEANQIVMSGCEDSLRAVQKFGDWSCVIIAQGDELTEAEQNRVDYWKGLSGRTPNEDSKMLTGNQGTGTYDPDRGKK